MHARCDDPSVPATDGELDRDYARIEFGLSLRLDHLGDVIANERRAETNRHRATPLPALSAGELPLLCLLVSERAEALRACLESDRIAPLPSDLRRELARFADGNLTCLRERLRAAAARMSPQIVCRKPHPVMPRRHAVREDSPLLAELLALHRAAEAEYGAYIGARLDRTDLPERHLWVLLLTRANVDDVLPSLTLDERILANAEMDRACHLLTRRRGGRLRLGTFEVPRL